MTEPLQQARYAAPAETPDAPRQVHTREWRPSRRAGFALLAGLGVLALAVLIGPELSQAPPAATAAATNRPSVTPSEPTLLPEPPGAREAAQDALAALLTRLESLQARKVDSWDAAGLAKILAARAAGEAHYRAGLYSAAQREYAAAEKAIAESLMRLPEVVAEHLDAGERALRSGQPEAAARSFTAALALSPGDSAATRGLARATHWDRVLALLAEAEGHLRLGDEARAVAAYEAALSLDPDAREATLGLARIQRKSREAQFGQEMSKGYAALGRGDTRVAVQAFEAALALQPSATLAAQALAEARAADRAASLTRALTRAARAKKNESWAEAVGALEEAVRLDPVLANSGIELEEIRQRAALAKRLRSVTQELQRHADEPVESGVREAALAAGADARRVRKPGPLLLRQVAALEAALAASPVEVAFRSDGSTEVMLDGTVVLGRFEARALALKPGRYTARGRRRGYRDAQVDFIVTAADAPPVVTVRCDDASSAGR